MFYYAIYTTKNGKTSLLEKDDFDTTQRRFAGLAVTLKAKKTRYSVTSGQRVLSSFYVGEVRYAFKRLKKRKIVP